MVEKISDKEYQASLENGMPSKIQAVDANNNPIVSTPANLVSTLENGCSFRWVTDTHGLE